MPELATLFGLIRTLGRDRTRLMLENAALRHQLAILKRSVSRPRIEDSDRIFWIGMRRMLAEWQDCLFFVKPETVVRWHRRGWRYYWRRKSKPRTQGRPPISFALIHLIKRLSRDNVTWGAPHIRDELALHGHDVAASTIAKYMVKHRSPDRARCWRTFIRNHMPVTAACDFFVVPTLTFKLLYGFVVLSHDRRRIVHIGVTTHPTAEWTARQIIEAFPGEGTEPRLLVRDRDSIYGDTFVRQVKAMGIRQMVTAHKSPWQNAFAERVIGTLRRECLDHIIPMGERHLARTLQEYVRYYNESRTHRSLDGDAPVPRPRPAAPVVELVAEPVLGGLHHRYRSAA